MAAVKPMMQQPSGAKPNTSYNNNNNEHTAALSMQQEQSITQVRVRKKETTVKYNNDKVLMLNTHDLVTRCFF